MKIPSVKSIHLIKKDDKICLLIVVCLDPSAPTAKSIFYVKTIAGFSVKVKAKRKSTTLLRQRSFPRPPTTNS